MINAVLNNPFARHTGGAMVAAILLGVCLSPATAATEDERALAGMQSALDAVIAQKVSRETYQAKKDKQLSIEILVLGIDDERPIAGARVALNGKHQARYTGQTDARGSLTASLKLLDITAITVTAPGMQTYRGQLLLTSEDQRSVVIKLDTRDNRHHPGDTVADRPSKF